MVDDVHIVWYYILVGNEIYMGVWEILLGKFFCGSCNAFGAWIPGNFMQTVSVDSIGFEQDGNKFLEFLKIGN